MFNGKKNVLNKFWKCCNRRALKITVYDTE